MFGFGKKKKKHKDSMPLESILALNYKRIQYASMRDPDTYKEIRLGTDGALNIIGDKMHIVCSGESVFAVMAHMAYCELQNKLIMSETTQTDINRVTAKRLRLAKIITEDMKKDSVLLDVVNRTYKQYDFDGNLLQWEIDYLKSKSHAGLEKTRKDVEYMTILNKYENE